MLRPRWLLGTVLVLAIVAGCIGAGLWQLDRLDQRRSRNDRVRARAGAVVPLPAVGFRPDAPVDDLVFRRVTVTGTYDPANELLIRFRSRRGLPGYEVVTPLRTQGGTVLVDRGWVPLRDGDRWPVPSGAPPAGEVTVQGLLAPPERGGARLARPTEPGRPTVAGAVDVDELAGALPYDDLYALHVLADASADNGAFPAPVDPPDLGEGPHRDYAVQWFLFATVGVIGWITLLRRRGPLRRRAAPASDVTA